MEFALGIVGTVVGIVVFVQGVTLIVMVARLIKLALWAPLNQTASRDTVPAAVLTVLDAAKPLLEQAGFQYSGLRRIRSMIASEAIGPEFCAAYYHPVHDMHAEVQSASIPTARWPFDIYLWDFYRDGRSLLTVNGLANLLIPYPKTVTIVDPYAPDFHDHLAAHLNARAAFAEQRADAADVPALGLEFAAGMLETLEREGRVYRRRDCPEKAAYGLTLWTALKMAWRIRNHSARRKRMETLDPGKDRQPVAAPAAVQEAAEQIAFTRTLGTLHSLRAPRWFRWAAFAVTAAGFLALGSWWWGAIAALVIGGVVLVHEAGHWLAMKLAGFRDVQVFFVPGMGAATSGEKHDANPFTHLLVYLAGPVPGLLLAVGAYGWIAFGAGDMTSGWFQVVAIGALAAFVINLLNLLPVLPLDGGRIVDLFVVARLPWLRFVFSVGSGILLLYGGISTGDYVLRALGILVLLGAAFHFRVAKASAGMLRSKVRAHLPFDDFQAVASQVHHFLAQRPFGSWDYNVKVNIGVALLPRLLGRLPNAKETLFGLGVYIASVALPLAAVIALFVMEPERMRVAVVDTFGHAMTSGAARDNARGAFDAAQAASHDTDLQVKDLRDLRETELAAAGTPGQRLAALNKIVHDAYEAEDYEDVLRFAKIYYTEAGAVSMTGHERAQAAKILAFALNDAAHAYGEAETERLLVEAEQLLRARIAEPAAALLLAEVQEGRAYLLSAADELPLRQEAVAIYAAHAETVADRLPYARLNLAKALDRAGQSAAAEQELRTAMAEAQGLPGAAYHARNLALSYSWFLVSQRRYEQADAVVAATLAEPGSGVAAPGYFQREAHLVAAFSARGRGDWNAVKTAALAMNARGNQAAEGTENWFWRFIVQRVASGARLDPDATLMLIEAERALGRQDNADQLAGDLRKQYSRHANGNPRCRYRSYAYGWRSEFAKTLLDTEMRELQCTV